MKRLLFSLVLYISIQAVIFAGNFDISQKHAVLPANDSTVILINNITSQAAHDKPVNCAIQYTDDRQIKINTQADILKKRREIIFSIWGEERIPARSDVIVSSNIESPLSRNSSLLRVDKIEIPARMMGVNGIDTLKDLAYFFVPVRRNNRLVMFSPGHICNFKHLPSDDHDYGVENTITGLLQAGYDVLAVYMPHVTGDTCNLDHCAVMNSFPDSVKYPVTFGLRFFLEPTIRCLNYLLLHNTYKNVNMAGLSGGGWTTNLLAAIDDRIKYSFSIAGSMPLYYRYGSSMGDIEQYLPQLYRDIAGYPDLYVLGAYGSGRKQVQILNRHDDCCFGEKQHNPARNYDADIKTFQKDVNDHLLLLNSGSHYQVLIDEEAPNHQISPHSLQVILKELMK